MVRTHKNTGFIDKKYSNISEKTVTTPILWGKNMEKADKNRGNANK